VVGCPLCKEAKVEACVRFRLAGKEGGREGRRQEVEGSIVRIKSVKTTTLTISPSLPPSLSPSLLYHYAPTADAIKDTHVQR
jgi:hypothetical protein